MSAKSEETTPLGNMVHKTQHTALNNELWSAFIKGNNNAFARLYELNIQDLFYYGLYFTSIDEVIKDAIQDVFVTIYSNRKNLKEVANVKVYLYVSLKNRLFAVFNKDPDYYQIDSMEPVFSLERSVEERYIDQEQETESKRNLRNMLQTLSPRQREVIYYRFTEGMSYEDICELMQMNYQSVRNLLHRSIQKIREISQHTDSRYNSEYKNKI
ncbi:MAG: sigma-70 family RNA polymerase sigma factor [Tannerellaceae bacterium]|nr:sigma-70 family RNA polymerase sigma factor [Tannerellaceae bacterium]